MRHNLEPSMQHQTIIHHKNESNYERPWESANSFGRKFNILFQSGDVAGLISFLESFAKKNPLNRDLIRQAYNQISGFGLSSLANECARVYSEACSQLLELGQSEFGLPTIFEFNYQYEIDSELVEQTAHTKVLLELGLLTMKPTFPLEKRKKSNFISAFYPYLEDSFEMVSENHEACATISQVTRFAPYVPLFYKFSDKKYGHNSSFAIDCYDELIPQNINISPFQLKPKTTDIATKFLKSFDLSPSDNFVVFFLREEGFFDEPNFGNNILNPMDFANSIDYFLQQGLKVVRIGHAKMHPIFRRKGFIDLTTVERPSEVDIFLCGQAKFYFGSGSGPISLAQTFGTPCCEINRINYAGVRADNFAQYLLFGDVITKRKCTFTDITMKGLKYNSSLKPFLDRKLVPYFPTPQENLKFAKESIDYFNKGEVFNINVSAKPKREKFRVWGGVNTESLGYLE